MANKNEKQKSSLLFKISIGIPIFLILWVLVKTLLGN
ncbi:MAG: hypothetical protein ACJAZK_002787 [Psychroserpens sp.]|jgi:hypothetical protein